MKKIYFADLTHTAQGVNSFTFPLGIGFVAAYIKTRFPDTFDVEVFKFPADLESAFNIAPADILCLSNYAWNKNIAMAFARAAKKVNENLIVIMGGPNFPLSDNERKKFLAENDCVDFYVFGEGEEGLALLLENLSLHQLNVNNFKRTKTQIRNCAYLLTDEDRMICGAWERIKDLSKMPCPYRSGVLDKFFDFPLVPMFERVRGCPFSCTFCTDGNITKSKVFCRTQEDVDATLKYIASKTRKSDALLITDLNFGMYNEDIKTAESVAKYKKEFGFPSFFMASAGKNKPENILKVARILENSWYVGSSMQSGDTEVLNNIKRKNIPINVMLSLAKEMGLAQLVNFTEVILALPGDTREKHYKSVQTGVDFGLTNIRMFQLMLLVGSEMNSIDSRNKFGFQTRWRVMPGCSGVYSFFGNDYRISEFEEIVVSSNSMSFDDYIDCRVMNLFVDVFVNNMLFEELLALFNVFGMKRFDFIVFLKDNYVHFQKIEEIISSYINDTKKDLFFTLEEIRRYSLEPNIIERHISGELGNNELLDHKAICYMKFADTVDFVFKVGMSYLEKHNHLSDDMKNYMENLRSFVLCRKKGLFDNLGDFSESFDYDFEELVKFNFSVNPLETKRASTYVFFHDEHQKEVIKNYCNVYGDSVSGLGRLLHNSEMTDLMRRFRKLAV